MRKPGIVAVALLMGCGGTPAGEATVEVEVRNVNAALPIVVHDRDGLPISTTSTDAHGHAYVAFPEGGMITIVDDAQHGGIRLRTYTDLQPGVHIVANDGPEAGSLGTLRVQLAEPVQDATTYRVSDGCAQAEIAPASVGELQVGRSCADPDGTTAALAVAYSGDTPLQWALASSLDGNLDGKGVTLPAWRDDWASGSLVLANPPPDGVSALVSAALEPRRLPAPTSGLMWIGPGGIDLSYRYAAPATDAVALAVVIPYGTGLDPDGSLELRTRSSALDRVEVDLTDDMLPTFNSLAVDAADPVRPAATATSSDPGRLADADAIIWGFSWHDPSAVVDGYWQLTTPATSTLKLPALPPELASRGPSNGTNGPVRSVQLEAVDSSLAASYAERLALSSELKVGETRRSASYASSPEL